MFRLRSDYNWGVCVCARVCLSLRVWLLLSGMMRVPLSIAPYHPHSFWTLGLEQDPFLNGRALNNFSTPDSLSFS